MQKQYVKTAGPGQPICVLPAGDGFDSRLLSAYVRSANVKELQTRNVKAMLEAAPEMDTAGLVAAVGPGGPCKMGLPDLHTSWGPLEPNFSTCFQLWPF